MSSKYDSSADFFTCYPFKPRNRDARPNNILIVNTLRLIEFADAPSASAAIEQFDFNELNGRKVHLRLDRSSVSVPDDACRVFVGNLPWEANDDMLASLFAQYGPIDCSVKTNMTGKSRGFGIVTFKSVEQAERAITETQNKELSGRALEV